MPLKTDACVPAFVSGHDFSRVGKGYRPGKYLTDQPRRDGFGGVRKAFTHPLPRISAPIKIAALVRAAIWQIELMGPRLLITEALSASMIPKCSANSRFFLQYCEYPGPSHR